MTLFVFLDTNVFIHCKIFTEIKWRELFKDNQNDEEIVIILPYMVNKELDNLKKYDKKARNIQNKLKELKDVEFNESITLNISIFPTKWSSLKPEWAELLDENESDCKIIAEILVFKEENPDNEVYFVTGDNTPYFQAKALGINTIFWLDEKYKEIFGSDDKKEKVPSLPDLGVYFNDQMSKELNLPKISEKTELLSIDDLLEDNFEFNDESELKYEVKEEIEELIDIYNKQLEQINNHQEINLTIRNDCNHPYNDIEIYITTILENDFILTIRELIKRPDKPKIPDYYDNGSLEKIRKDLQTGIYLRGTEKIVRMHNLKLNMHISSENKGKHNKWEVVYHIDRIKHNKMIDLHPLLIFSPDSYKTNRIELKIAYSHEEPGKIKEQKRIVYLPKSF